MPRFCLPRQTRQMQNFSASLRKGKRRVSTIQSSEKFTPENAKYLELIQSNVHFR